MYPRTEYIRVREGTRPGTRMLVGLVILLQLYAVPAESMQAHIYRDWMESLEVCLRESLADPEQLQQQQQQQQQQQRQRRRQQEQTQEQEQEQQQ